MTRRRQFNERKLLKVYLDEADFQRITEAAKSSGLSISEWVRNRCLVHSVQYTHVLQGGIETNPTSHAVLDAACPHKKRKGELCYKCDPKFGLPSIV